MKPKLLSWELIGTVIEQVVDNMEAGQDITTSSANYTSHFNSIRIPGISIMAYLSRIHFYADCSDSCYILAFIYIDRLLQNNPGLVLSYRNIHRLLLTAVLLAIKYSDDIYAENLAYAKIGGIPLDELNVLEVDMLKLLHYSLHVNSELYFQYANEVELQAQKIREEKLEGEKMECCDSYAKPIKTVSSVTSMRTLGSANEMACD